jgi:methyl-accepting chemotaxis protein
MAAQTKLLTAGGPPVAATARTGGRDPGRQGAVRLALLGALLAAVAGGAAVFITETFLEREAIDHLESVQAGARHELTATVEGFQSATSELAADPRLGVALTELSDGFRRAGTDLGGEKAATAKRAKLTEFYTAETAGKKGGAAANPADLVPENATGTVKDAPILLQSLYLAENPHPAGERDALLDAGDGSQYSGAHGRHHPWLAALARRYGWENVTLVDRASGHAVYTSAKSPETFTNLTSGPYRAGSLARAAAQVADSASKGVKLTDAAGDGGAIHAAIPIVRGGKPVGTLVATMSQERIDEAIAPGTGPDRWKRLGLGERGEVLAVGTDNRLRSTARSGAATTSSGVKTALAGAATTGVFSDGGEPRIGSYGPFDVGESRWAIAVERPQSEVRAVLMSLLPLLALMALGGGAVGWMLGARLWRQFAGRLRQLSDVLQRAQKGDRRARLEMNASGPVGDLAAGIDRLLEERARALDRADQEEQRLSREAEQLLEAVSAAARGQLDARAPLVNGPLKNVSLALNEMLEHLRVLTESMRGASSRVGDSAERLRKNAEEASAGATSQTRDCASTQGSTKEIRAHHGRLAEQCQRALESTRRGEQASRMGQSAVNDVLGGLDALQRETRAATVKIKRLGERSMQISAIIGTISKMSAQTDMLALNAAIEASRAGEQGQGFTVVAEEVRKLAERASAATKEIERLIAGIQSDVNEAVGGMERQTERLEVQSAATAEASHALEKVTATTVEAAQLVQDVNESSQKQLESVDQLGNALGKIGDMSKTLQQYSEQTRRSSRELLTLSEELGGQATEFGIGDA